MKQIFSKIRGKRIAPPSIADGAQLDRIAAIIEAAPGVNANTFLAFTGDKRFLISASGRSFIMFGLKGRAWVAVGAAIGADDEKADLERDFIKMAKAARGFASFYGVTAQDAGRLQTAGLIQEKLGERATVHLDGYSFSGRPKRDIRSARNKALEAGCRFELMDYSRASGHLDALRAVSDNWLAANSGFEKQFSLGRFDPDYLKYFRVAVIFKDDSPIAFATLWFHNDAVVIDMMRYVSPAQSGLMDYLFMEIILWAQDGGFKTFDMGAAPLAGLAEQPSASAVGKLGGLIFIKGGKFYNFAGLRAFKNKFDPDWTPIYICAASPLRAGAAAMAVAALTGLGLRKQLRRIRPFKS